MQKLALVTLISMFFLALIRSTPTYAAKDCGSFLDTNTSQSTKNLMAYMAQLLDEQILGVEQLKVIIEGIQKNRQIINPLSPNSSSGERIHHELLGEHLKQKDLEPHIILQWALSQLDKSEQVKKQKQQTRNETKEAKTIMQFHPIEKGGEINHSFEAMSTPVTQRMWVEIMEKNPSHFTGNNGEMSPEHPVEDITWYSAAEFANRLSKKHGLPEVYDFSKMRFRQGTSPEAGDWEPEETSLIRVGINAPEGNIYLAEGFRLPTVAEQVFLLTDRGRSTTEYFSGVEEKNLKDYAWFEVNSNKSTHPVATKNALIIDGKDFYDLYGNVSEWSTDWNTYPFEPIEENISRNTEKYFSSGGWLDTDVRLRAKEQVPMRPSLRYFSLGFRLVKSVKE